MTSVQTIPWKRFATESVVIVASILLAFAIDAWWEDRQEQREQIERLRRVAAEIELNREIVGEKIETLRRAIDGVSEYLSWMGPEPGDVSHDKFSRQWDQMVDIGMYSLVHRATDEYLGAGGVLDDTRSGVRTTLLGWYAEGDRIEKQYDLLRSRHNELTTYTIGTGEPILATMGHLPVMQAHPKSRFPADIPKSLSDPRAESLLALYLVRLEFVVRRMTAYQEYQDDLLAKIGAETARP